MRKFIAILVCKISRFILKKLGRGSSMPGKIALKIYPDVLDSIQMPDYIIAVTGSNGKSSTVEMINEVLKRAHYSVAYNSEGSNQIDGAATLILCNCSLSGKFKKDVLLIESDERYAQYTFKYFSPTHYVIGNLYRDQMTRNGHHEFVMKEIEKSINRDSTLILNADVPIVAALGETHINKCVYFGINDDTNTYIDNDFLYNDGYYCPVCKSKMIYDYHHFGHVGKYQCLNCDFKRVDPKYAITNIDLKNGALLINDSCEIKLAFNSIYNAYNILAAYTVCSLVGAQDYEIGEALNNYLVHNGRVKQFDLGDGNKGTLLISKHENSVCYNENIRYVVDSEQDVTVFIMVDAISRKYFTSETSWLWDINFDLLKADNVKQILLVGQYCYDLALRFEYTDIDQNKIHVEKDIHTAIDYLKQEAIGHTYVLTCFSDEAKFNGEVNVI